MSRIWDVHCGMPTVGCRIWNKEVGGQFIPIAILIIPLGSRIGYSQWKRCGASPVQFKRCGASRPVFGVHGQKPLASAFAANWDAGNILKSNRTANRIAFTTLWCLIGIQAISMLVTVSPGRDRGSAKVAQWKRCGASRPVPNSSGAAQAARCLEYTAKTAG